MRADTQSWAVVTPGLWAKLSEIRRSEIRSWLKMNGINPSLVPADSEILIGPGDEDTWVIVYEEYYTDEESRILVDPDKTDEAWVRVEMAPLVIDPPMEWLIPVTNA